MDRPCEQIITIKGGDIAPEDINMFASDTYAFCKLILGMDNVDDIHRVAEAVQDNWKRYVDSV